MRKIFIAAALVVLCLSFSAIFAQSRRSPTEAGDTKKANARPAATPAPVKTETAPENQTDENAIVDDTDVIEVATEVVTIPVKVFDRKGRFVAGLQKENFSVTEDNTPQEIAFFSNEQEPFTVALVLDMSYSTKFKINEIQQAAIGFIEQLRKDDKVMVISFDQDIHVLTEPTGDRQKIYNAIRQTRIAYGTSLYEAVNFVVNQRLKKVKGRNAVVLFTDGVDTSSKGFDESGNLRDLEEIDTIVYPIRYDTYADVQAIKNQTVTFPPTAPVPGSKSPLPFPLPPGGIGTADGPGTRPEDYERAARYLNDMAEKTGGTIYQADSIANLDQAFASIAGELRQIYSIGYYPPEGTPEGKKRRIKVRVDQKGLAIKARDSYTVGKKAAKK